MNLARENHIHRSREREHALANHLVVLGLGDTRLQACSKVDRHGLSQKARAGVELQNAAPMCGAVSGLFDEFALRGLEFVLTRVDASSGQFP